MRTIIIRIFAALAVMGAVSATASAATAMNGIDAGRGPRADVVQAAYYYHHHHYGHRRWEHSHWRYY
jgi:hypothetical protein